MLLDNIIKKSFHTCLNDRVHKTYKCCSIISSKLRCKSHGKSFYVTDLHVITLLEYAMLRFIWCLDDSAWKTCTAHLILWCSLHFLLCLYLIISTMHTTIYDNLMIPCRQCIKCSLCCSYASLMKLKSVSKTLRWYCLASIVFLCCLIEYLEQSNKSDKIFFECLKRKENHLPKQPVTIVHGVCL